jgi:hypothetical protein
MIFGTNRLEEATRALVAEQIAGKPQMRQQITSNVRKWKSGGYLQAS